MCNNGLNHSPFSFAKLLTSGPQEKSTYQEKLVKFKDNALCLVSQISIKGYLETIALEPIAREIQTLCHYNSEIHEVNSNIADYCTSAKFEYLAKARVCQILPWGGVGSYFLFKVTCYSGRVGQDTECRN